MVGMTAIPTRSSPKITGGTGLHEVHADNAPMPSPAGFTPVSRANRATKRQEPGLPKGSWATALTNVAEAPAGLRITRLLLRRFWSRIDRSGGPRACWPWTASKNRYGYGKVMARGAMLQAHRVAYELAVGTIPDGLTIDHLCRNQACCNPAHLEPVTAAENTRRAWAARALPQQCRNGHEYTPENIYEYRGQRACRTCRRLANQRVTARQAVSQ